MELFLYYPCLRAGYFISYLRCLLDILSQMSAMGSISAAGDDRQECRH